MKKKILIALGAVAVLVIAAVVGLLLTINFWFKKGVDYGATFALGVPTSIAGANVGVFSGQCTIERLRVGNPTGFPSDHFLTMGQADVAVALGSLLQPVVEIPRLQLKDIDVVLEKREGKANYQVILDNLGSAEQTPPPAQQKEGKKFIIRDLTIQNVAVTVDLLPVGGQLSRQRIVVPEIHLQNVGAEGNRGVMMAELTKVVVQSIFQSLMEGGAQLPGEVMAQLQQGLGQLAPIGQYGMKVVGDVKSQVGQITQGVGAAVGGLQQQVGDVQKVVPDAGKQIENLGKGLGGLLGGKKSEPQQPATQQQ
jgi:hypothetical protein